VPKATVQTSNDSVTFDLPSAELSFIPFGAEGAVLLGSARREYVAGSLRALGIAEVFGLILSGIRTGKLVVAAGALRKTVAFRDGQVVFATSTESHERLGATLVRLGLVTPGQLTEGLAQLRPGARLGQVLRKSQVLSAAGLYSALAAQVREIVLSLASQEEGDFLFLEGPVTSGDSIKLPERTQALVLEGLKRADAVARLRKKFGAARFRQGVAPPEAAKAIWERAAGGADVAALRLGLPASEHDFFAQLEDLVRDGALVEVVAAAAAAPASLPPSPPSPLDRYSALVKTICDALGAAGRDLADLRSFFEDPLPGMEAAFAGVTLSEGGQLDVKRVLSNAAPNNEALGRAKAYEALDAFVSYALFSAKNVLPAELAESLARDFRRIHEGEA
jgi:hypothetical protein